MSGDIDLCRTSPKAIPLRVMQEVIAELGGKGVVRSWEICGLYCMLEWSHSPCNSRFAEVSAMAATEKSATAEIARKLIFFIVITLFLIEWWLKSGFRRVAFSAVAPGWRSAGPGIGSRRRRNPGTNRC